MSPQLLENIFTRHYVSIWHAQKSSRRLLFKIFENVVKTENKRFVAFNPDSYEVFSIRPVNVLLEFLAVSEISSRISCKTCSSGIASRQPSYRMAISSLGNVYKNLQVLRRHLGGLAQMSYRSVVAVLMCRSRCLGQIHKISLRILQDVLAFTGK